MGLDVWFRDDVIRILAGLARQVNRNADESYRMAYMDALGDIAVSFGIPVDEATKRFFLGVKKVV